MGYKLAGFDVIGCNEIDPKMMKCYIENHNPQYTFLEDIRDLVRRNNLPEELYNLDILDGSPPCSTFSLSLIHISKQIRQILKWGKAEVSHFVEYEGCKFKYRPDVETAKKIIDWKTRCV